MHLYKDAINGLVLTHRYLDEHFVQKTGFSIAKAFSIVLFDLDDFSAI